MRLRLGRRACSVPHEFGRVMCVDIRRRLERELRFLECGVVDKVEDRLDDLGGECGVVVQEMGGDEVVCGKVSRVDI